MTVVVGAGLAGSTCGKVLAAARRPFVLCEASGRPGGRAVTDRSPDGFLLDRGFQVLLDSYPTARRHLDFGALGGGRFRAGALFVGRGRPRTLENPLRRPSALRGALRADVLPITDLFRLLRLVIRSLGLRGVDETLSTEALLRGYGFREEFFTRFARPFIGGVLLDPGLQTSGEVFLGYLRRFVSGRALLPAAGIGAVAEQLVAGIPRERIRYKMRAEELVFAGGKVCGVRFANGIFLAGDQVILAVDEPAACRLLGTGRPRAAQATAVHYFAADRPSYAGAWLCLPPRREDSPVLHAALLSNAAPSLAPRGGHLWSVTVLPGHPRASDAELVGAEVASWFGADPRSLRPLAFVEVPYAVPAQLPGFRRRPSPWGVLPRGVETAGDTVCGASIDAVMASGERVAKKLISRGRLN
jgi:phytoene dehydrogenase-like protein